MLLNSNLLSGETLNVALTNLSAEDARFLRSFLAIFTDPQKARLAFELRNGRLAIQYSPTDGELAFLDLNSDAMPTPAELIQFVARFQDWEWEQLSADRSFVSLIRRDICEAEARAREVLGYLPEPVKFEVVRG